MPRFHRFVPLVRILACTLVVSLLSPVLALADTAQFAIKAEPLPLALKAFAQQAHMQLLYEYAIVRDIRGNPVSGVIEKHAALEQLLRNTGLEAIFSSESAATIKPISRTPPGEPGAAKSPIPSTNATDPKQAAKSHAADGRTAGADRTDPAAETPATAGLASVTDQTQTLNEVIVTGAPTFSGVSRLHASFSVTTASRQEIKEANPVSVADLLKLSPGIFPESSGGQTGANIEVAGFPSDSGAPFATFEMEGMPLFPRWSYFEDAMFRLDDTISHVEMLQGGPSVLYGIGQPGLIANFLLRKGSKKPHGDVGVTFFSEGGERVDAFYGFPIGHSGWVGSIGGFWQKSDGVRDPQFPADEGGQLTATLSRDFDHGSVMFYARALKVHNQFVTDTPIYNPAPGKFSPWPGFNPLTGTFGSYANQHQVWQVSPCFTPGCTPGTYNADMGIGRGANIQIVGGSLSFDLGRGWSISNAFQGMIGRAPQFAFFSTGQNPETLASFISGAESNFVLPPNLTATARYTTGGAVPMNELVTVQNPESILEHPKSISDEFHVNKELFSGNTLTAGTYLAFFERKLVGHEGAMQLLQAQTNPTPIVVALNDGTNNYQLTDSQGIFYTQPQSWMEDTENYHESKVALFLTDSWHIRKWWLSGGLREEHDRLNGWIQNTSSGDLDANPYTLYNNQAPYLVSGITSASYSKTAPLAWTVGGAYAFDNHMSTYVRVNDGVFMPGFDTVYYQPDVPVEEIHNVEVGFKYQAPWVFVDISAYRRLFSGIPYQFQSPTQTINLVYGSSTNGVDLQGVLRPFHNFSIGFGADYMDGTYTNYLGCVPYTAQDGSTQCGVIDGKQLDRQPRFQYRLTPAYVVPMNWGGMRFWFTYEHVGNRYGDQLNQQPLGSYYDFAVGASADIGDHWSLMLRGTNVTNEVGITEGNARLFGFASGGGVILARSIQGREMNFQIKYRF